MPTGPKDDAWPGLIIEVTEGEVASDVGLAHEIATQLNIYGIKLAIDDFGEGYSSFARLRDLPFAELKLDASFVQNCAEDTKNAAICRAVIELAHSFGAVAVAEGLETAADVQAIQRMGCDLGQGFLFARPMPSTLFIGTDAKQDPRRRVLVHCLQSRCRGGASGLTGGSGSGGNAARGSQGCGDGGSVGDRHKIHNTTPGAAIPAAGCGGRGPGACDLPSPGTTPPRGTFRMGDCALYLAAHPPRLRRAPGVQLGRNHIQTSAPRCDCRRRTGRRLRRGHPDQVQEPSRTATSRSASTSSSRYPAPYGLIRYGVAPDHPRIKGIVNALHKVLDRGDIRFFGNVDYGRDLTLRRPPRLLRRRHLRHRRHQGRGPGHSRASSSTAPSAAPTSSPGTTATRTCRATGRWRPRRSP